nr:hypothetical protein [Tanacetum cinerariifolium]
MVSSIQESEYFNPHEMENDDSPALEQKTFHYNEESIDTIDSSNDSQENEVGSHLSENVSRWHVCKPVHITFKENGILKQWICFLDHKRQNVEGNGMKFDVFLKLRTTKYTDPYDLHHKSNSPSNDTLRINTYFPDISKTQLMKSRIKENSFEEWMKIKLGNINIKDSMRSVMFKEWVNKDFNFGVHFGRTKDDPYSRNFDLYTDEFNKEIEQSWYDEGFKKEELWQNGIEEIDYTPPLAKYETFKVHRYTIKNEKSFISITKQMNDVLHLGRVNESRFIEKTRKEMDEGGGAIRKT